jgi:TolB-like protein/Flp pilus assembly protein TadD
LRRAGRARIDPATSIGHAVIYQFGNCVLDPARRELRQGDGLVAVEPQVFDVLTFLIEARDRVVSRDDLLDAVWHGRIVSEATLSSRLNAARTVIGDDGAKQRLIRTLPRKGVRFVGEVREIADPAPEPPGDIAPAEAIAWRGGSKLPSVAVLPFTNMSGDPEQDYFADGMAEEIITALSRNSGLFVIARNSSFTYKGKAIDVRRVGQELGVGYVVEGSVRRGRERLRITGQLVDAVSGAHLWSDRFDGDPRNVFELQDRVSESVAAAIEPTLQFAEIGRLRRDRPTRPDAYDHLLRAYALLSDFTAASMGAALRCLDQSLSVDPTYAPAMAAAAYCRAQCHFQGWAQQDDAGRAEAVRLAWRAVELAPNDAQVLWMAAFAVWNMARAGRERARDLFSRSLLINPNSAMALTLAGWIETMCGNQSAGREMVARAQRLNPRDPRGWLMSGVMAIADVIDENYAEAVRWAERALAQNRRFAVALRVLAVALVKLGQQDRAGKAVQELLEIQPELTISGFFARIPVPLERMAKTYADALRAAGLPE